MNRHEFQQQVRHFRAGKISLDQLTDRVFAGANQLGSAPVFTEAMEAVVATLADQGELPALKLRPVDAHKGSFGRVLLIGGSRGMGGAIALSAMAALRSGSGLVTAAIPESVADTVASFDPCIMTLPCRDNGGQFSSLPSILKQQLPLSDVIAIGPGMGRGVDRYFLESVLGVDKPVVIDADAIHVLADAHLAISKRSAPTILTPHPGEFSNLTNQEYADRAATEQAADLFAKENACVMVLKGHRTLVTDGTTNYRNESGNVGMASAGSGDVLTGVIASLVGQGYSAFEAATLGVYLHGRAGDFAAEELGAVSMVASDILDSLSDAFQAHGNAT